MAKLLFVALGSLLLASLALAADEVKPQTTPQTVPQQQQQRQNNASPAADTNELHFNDKQTDDTHVITDNQQLSTIAPQPAGPQQQQADDQSNQFYSSEGEDSDTDLSPSPPPRPFGGQQPGFGPFGFGGDNQPFRGGPFGSQGGSLFSHLFGGGSPLFDFGRHARHFERQFQNLERQASEGQDVSYFNRNGVAYVRTCTTKKVSGGSQPESQQVNN